MRARRWSTPLTPRVAAARSDIHDAPRAAVAPARCAGVRRAAAMSKNFLKHDACQREPWRPLAKLGRADCGWWPNSLRKRESTLQNGDGYPMTHGSFVGTSDDSAQ